MTPRAKFTARKRTGRGLPGAGAAVCALAVVAGPLAGQDLFLRGGRIVDPESRQIEEANLLVVDGRIAGRPAEPPARFAGEVVDLDGRWVVPSYKDLHTHSFGNGGPAGVGEMLGTPGVAERVLRAGVTAFLDLFNMEDVILAFRDQQRAGEAGGADVYASGPCFTATDGHCTEYGIPTRVVNTPEEARAQVAGLAPKRPDVVKIVYDNATYGTRTLPTVDRATMEAVVAAAREHGLPTVVHIGTWEDVRDAVEAGAAAITHTPGPDTIPAELAELMAEHEVASIPTLAVQSDLSRLVEDPDLLDDPILRRTASEELVQSYRDWDPGAAGSAPMAGWIRRQQEQWTSYAESVRLLAEAGVTLIAGTDAGNPGVFQGWSVLREITLLVDAGLDEWDALAAATVNGEHLLDTSWGVAEGDEASLVVLDASPIEDIRNAGRLWMVVHHGRVVTGQEMGWPE